MQIVYPFEMVFLSWLDHKLHEYVRGGSEGD